MNFLFVKRAIMKSLFLEKHFSWNQFVLVLRDKYLLLNFDVYNIIIFS